MDKFVTRTKRSTPRPMSFVVMDPLIGRGLNPLVTSIIQTFLWGHSWARLLDSLSFERALQQTIDCHDPSVVVLLTRVHPQRHRLVDCMLDFRPLVCHPLFVWTVERLLNKGWFRAKWHQMKEVVKFQSMPVIRRIERMWKYKGVHIFNDSFMVRPDEFVEANRLDLLEIWLSEQYINNRDKRVIPEVLVEASLRTQNVNIMKWIFEHVPGVSYVFRNKVTRYRSLLTGCPLCVKWIFESQEYKPTQDDLIMFLHNVVYRPQSSVFVHLVEWLCLEIGDTNIDWTFQEIAQLGSHFPPIFERLVKYVDRDRLITLLLQSGNVNNEVMMSVSGVHDLPTFTPEEASTLPLVSLMWMSKVHSVECILNRPALTNGRFSEVLKIKQNTMEALRWVVDRWSIDYSIQGSNMIWVAHNNVGSCCRDVIEFLHDEGLSNMAPVWWNVALVRVGRISISTLIEQCRWKILWAIDEPPPTSTLNPQTCFDILTRYHHDCTPALWFLKRVAEHDKSRIVDMFPILRQFDDWSVAHMMIVADIDPTLAPPVRMIDSLLHHRPDYVLRHVNVHWSLSTVLQKTYGYHETAIWMKLWDLCENDPTLQQEWIHYAKQQRAHEAFKCLYLTYGVMLSYVEATEQYDGDHHDVFRSWHEQNVIDLYFKKTSLLAPLISSLEIL
eukprot:GILJ01018811.1.p1 GENE.GILJ01018811.1~~GILJ01018811.1.p1  ORF type:complete len:668 (-),score=28.56 GILJ01018811.1:115-2118(-)